MRGIKYKDTTAAPGSKLYAALEVKDLKLAEKLYNECEKEYRKWWPKANVKIPEVAESNSTGSTVQATEG